MKIEKRKISKAPNGLSNDERFERMLVSDPETGCRLWQGATTCWGHGHFNVKLPDGRYRTVIAHRHAYKRYVGPIPDGMMVCHKCNVPNCVNVDHLYIGTAADNCRDMRVAGTHISTRPELQRGSANGRAKLTEEDARRIRDDYRPGRPFHVGNWPELAAKYGVSESTIRNIVGGRQFAVN